MSVWIAVYFNRTRQHRRSKCNIIQLNRLRDCRVIFIFVVPRTIACCPQLAALTLFSTFKFQYIIQTILTVTDVWLLKTYELSEETSRPIYRLLPYDLFLIAIVQQSMCKVSVIFKPYLWPYEFFTVGVDV